MRSFQQRLSEFRSRGVQVVAISVGSVEINRGHAQKMHFAFPLLSDANAAVIRRYDVLHRGAGPKNVDIARPAEFYVDANGTVRWVNLTENIA
ncbi:MAG: peroxiredoxin, partial [Verrucomicrobia bacterium]